jgi:hypothetical protein
MKKILDVPARPISSILIDLLSIVFIVINYEIKPKPSLSLVADERENGQYAQPILPVGRIL